MVHLYLGHDKRTPTLEHNGTRGGPCLSEVAAQTVLLERYLSEVPPLVLGAGRLRHLLVLR